jgi:hypothetical protein
MLVEHLIDIANGSAEQVEKNARLTISNADRAGRALIEIKKQIPHGQWLAWLGANFNYSQQTASDYMRIAEYGHARNLADATSVRHALRMIAEHTETTKRERQSGVQVIEPEKTEEPIEVESTPVKEPREPKPSGNPRNNAAPRTSSQAEPEFDLGSSLDEHRSAILEMAGDYAAAKQTKHFIVMLRKVAADLEVTTPGGAN